MPSTVSFVISHNVLGKDGWYTRGFMHAKIAGASSNGPGQSAIESAKNDHAMVVQSMLDNKAGKTVFENRFLCFSVKTSTLLVSLRAAFG